MDQSIIAALATAPGQAGLAVVRISGSGAAALADQCFRFGPLPKEKVKSSSSPGNRSLVAMEGYSAALGYLIDEANEQIIDQCIALRFVAPKSYTGEETVEFSFHGGSALRRQVLELLFRLGAKAAGPGEFTKRAFMNGKLDLTQAEAVADLISAEAQLSSKAAVSQLQGHLSLAFAKFREKLFALMAQFEIAIDYPEHEDFSFAEDKLPTVLSSMRLDLQELLSSYRQSLSLKQGLQVALVGAPNVGKSSLLNALSGQERAIVTDVAGTTRDTVDSLIEIEGIPVRLIDTAGIRESSDKVEQIGVARSLKVIREADFILWTIAPELISGKTAKEAAALLQEDLRSIPKSVPFCLLLNKQDLPGAEGLATFVQREVMPLLSLGRPENQGYSQAELYLVSAQSGQGLEEVRQAIGRIYDSLGSGRTGQLRLSSERHVDVVRRALILLEKIEADLAYLPTDILSQSLLAVADILGEISGERVNETLIHEIFSRFCVGK